MSNTRRPGLNNLYRAEYLRSRAWFARRDRWFHDHTATGTPLACAACSLPAAPAQVELHHLDYRGVILTGGRWCAFEDHDDLLPLHPYCHDLLHRLIDRDTVLAKNRDRRTATHLALTRLRTSLTAAREPVHRDT